MLIITSDKYPPFRVDMAVLFCKELAKKGHKIDFVMQSDRDNNNFYKVSYQRITYYIGSTDNGIKRVNRLHKHILSLINDLRFIRLAKRKNYDFIQVKDKFVAAIFGIVVAKFRKIKFFFWLSYPFPESDIYEYRKGSARYPFLYLIRGNFLKIILYHIILPFSDHIFVQSKKMKEDLICKGSSEDKLTPIPMGIDLDDYKNIFDNDDMHNNNKDNTIIYLGTMQKIRRIDFVLRAFKEVLEQIPIATLYMIGGSDNEEDMKYLKREAEKLKIEHATVFTGNLERKKALLFLKKSSIGLSPFLPSPVLDSTSPTKLIEYMAMGLPVVANNHPEQKFILDKSKAGICVPYDEKLFAKAIIALLKNKENLTQIGIRGKKYVELHRNYKKIADELEDKYCKLIYL